MPIDFTVEGQSRKRRVSLELKGALICGYTGRDQHAVRQHISELEKQGIAPPPSVPMFYPKANWGICAGGDIQVQGGETSGEVEFVLLVHQGTVYVGLGSDHTDRELEKHSVVKSKQVCPSVLARTLWLYEEIEDHWDDIEMRSWVTCGGDKRLYQQSKVASLLRPDDLLSKIRERACHKPEDLAIFSGTSSLLTDGFVFANRFEAELSDPVLQRAIRLAYDVHTLDWRCEG